MLTVDCEKYFGFSQRIAATIAKIYSEKKINALIEEVFYSV